MPAKRTHTKGITLAASIVFLGLTTAQAYEQGSYLIIDVIDAQSKKPAKTVGVTIDQKHFANGDTPSDDPEANDSGSSEFLAGLNTEIGKSKNGFTDTVSLEEEEEPVFKKTSGSTLTFDLDDNTSSIFGN
ncbi:MAG: hypothetical protein ACSHYA_04985 [Opitutaceae bacterium]